MSVIEKRREQIFPVLDAAQVETAKRFASGPARDFAPGEIVFDVGERNAPAWLVLKGSIDVVRRNALNREMPITTHEAGQISGEISQLAGRETLACGRAGANGCTALPFDAAHIRALMIGSAEVGEIVMRAFILRRVGLIEDGGAGSVLVGIPGTPRNDRTSRLVATASTRRHVRRANIVGPPCSSSMSSKQEATERTEMESKTPLSLFPPVRILCLYGRQYP